MKAFTGERGREGGAMPQVEKDKRCFPLNKETVKNTFVSEQLCVRVCVLVGTCARSRECV